MKISITGKHIEVRPGMKTYVEQRLEKLRRFFSAVNEAHIVLKTEKYLNTAEISLNGKKLHLYAEGSSEENLYVAIDRAVDRIENQIKRQTEKIKGRSHRGLETAKAGVLAGREESRLEPNVEREIFDTKPMTVDEACEQLDVTGQNFLVFQNAGTGQISVIFKKKSGNYGLVEPEL